MPQTLALLHTTQIFLHNDPIFRDLLAEIMPDVKLVNIVDDSLLPHCMAEQRITPAAVKRMCLYVMAAEAAGADAVLSLCSSLGPAIDTARSLVSLPVIKIDDAHTEKAAREYNRIGVMATVQTTLEPTLALIQEKADALSRKVEIRPALASAAFEALTGGDRPCHDALLMEAAQALAGKVDVILFAQASMTRLAPRMEQETRLPVLTSPRLAVERAKQVLDGLAEKHEIALLA